eukprot:Tbor_TRINITY_DN2782_c0_g1::TRINITY_DN2782_c0_g1_i1::g.15248::m.15248
MFRNTPSINFDDPNIDWANALPPHIAAEQRRQQQLQEAMRPRQPQLMMTFPLRDDDINALNVQRQQTLARREATQRRREAGERVRDPRQGPVLRPGTKQPVHVPTLQSSGLVSATSVRNSRRDLVAAREAQMYNEWSGVVPQGFQREVTRGQRGSRRQTAPVEQTLINTPLRRQSEMNEQIREIQMTDQTDQNVASDRNAPPNNREASGEQVGHLHPPCVSNRLHNVTQELREMQVPNMPVAADTLLSTSTVDQLTNAQLRQEEEEHMYLLEALPGAMLTRSPTPPNQHSERGTSSEQVPGSREVSRSRPPATLAAGLPSPGHGRRANTAENIFGMSPPVSGATAEGGGERGSSISGEWEISDFSYDRLIDLGSMAVCTGLSKKQLERYKPYQLVLPSRADIEDCAICLEPLVEGGRVLKIQCQHTFHYPCIIQWLARTNQCPVCRFEIPRTDAIRV